MKLRMIKQIIFSLLFGLIITGNAYATIEIKIDDAEAAVLYANVLDTKHEKISYLLYYANEFMENEQYEDVNEIANHILVELDKTSKEAKTLLVKVKIKTEKTKIFAINPVEIKF